MGLFIPNVARAEYYDYFGTPADVVIGIQTYLVGTIWGTGGYLGPSPTQACQNMAAVTQLEFTPGFFSFVGLVDLGGSDVFDHGNTPYYHNYYCTVSGDRGIQQFNMSRAAVRCPATVPPGHTAYSVVRDGYFQLIPPLHVDSCISFLPPQITIDLRKKHTNFCAGNPIYPATGNKSQVDNDYAGAGDFPLVFTRTYNSSAALGAGWRNSYERTIQEQKMLTATSMKVVRGDSTEWTFRVNTAGYWFTDSDVNAGLAGAMSIGMTLTTENDEQETYSPAGKLLSIKNRAGLTQTLTYSDANTAIAIAPVAGLLITVVDSFGRQLNFTYDSASRVKTMTDPLGGVYQYAYDTGGNLSTVTYPDARMRTYRYNEAALTAGTSLPNALTGIIDENTQRYANFGYNASGLAIMSEHAGGAERMSVNYGTPPIPRTTVYYDPLKNLEITTIYYDPPAATTITDSLGTVRSYGFGSAASMIVNTGVDQPCSSGCGASASALTYDINGNVASRTDFNGNKTTYTFDLTRNLETQRIEGLTSAGATTPQTRTITSEWHPTLRVMKRMAEPKRLTSYTWNGDGGIFCSPTTTVGVMCSKTVTETTDATGSLGLGATLATPSNARTWTYTYNALGQVLSVNGPRTDVTDVTSYTYYTTTTANYRMGDLATVSNVLGHVTTISSYDAHGRPTSISDANGLVTTLTYHPRGWLASRHAGSLVTLFDYDNVGQLTKVTLPDASFIGYTYDAAHRLTDITNTVSETIHYTLDLMGNRTQEQVKDSLGVVKQQRSRTFDALSRLATELNGANALIASYTYDNNGNLKTATQKVDASTANDEVTAYDYDPLNRLSKLTDALAGMTLYGYDGVDHLVSVTDPKSLVTSYSVDGLDNPKQLVSPDTGTINSTYDAAGNLKTRTDARARVSTYSYDALNRVTGVTFSTTPTITYTYDDITLGNKGKGRLTKVSNSAGMTEYVYDSQGRITQKKQTTGTGVDLKVHTLIYSYNASTGRLDSLTYPSGKLIAYSYDAQGRVSGMTVNGLILVSAITYQAFGVAKSWMWSGGPLLTRGFDLDGRQTSYPYTSTGTVNIAYDLADRITGFSGTVTKAFTYDKLDRLKTDGTTTFNYDADGNRSSVLVGATSYAYTYAANSNKLTAIAGPTAATYGLDVSGNVTTTAGNTYAYDSRGRLANITGATSNTYGIDGLGQRVTKAGTGYTGTIRFIYGEDGKLLGEYDNTGAIIAEHVYLQDTPIAVLKTAGAYLVQSDHLNTPRAILGAANAVVWKWDSDAFGTTAANENPSALGAFNYNLRFPGQYYDKETANHYNYFRDNYNPKIGRYMQSDPIGLRGGINTYAYTGSQPTKYTDSTGLQTIAPPIPFPAVPPWFLPAVAAGWAGWEIGNMINPYIQPTISKVVDMCMKSESNDDHCESLNKIDTKTCNAISRRRGAPAGAACHASASERYAACLRGHSLPPLNTWNN